MFCSGLVKHLFVLVLSFSGFRAEDVKSSATPAGAAMEILKLHRSSVMLPQDAHRAGKRKNFYSATLRVGNPPQEFKVSFDLGGGTMVLPSKTCTDHACLQRHRYNKWDSSTAEDIQANGQLVEPKVPKTLLSRRQQGTLGLDSIDIGSGKVVGNFVREQICVLGDSGESLKSEPRCFPLALLAANTMSDLPFLTEPYDGTVGLGLSGMSMSNEFNFLTSYQQGYYMNSLAVNSFGLHLGSDSDGGEIVFGGYDTKRLTGPLRWTSVKAPEEGRWQVSVSAVRVGNATLEACRKRPCRAVLDYSSSLLSAPTGLVGNLESSLADFAIPEGFSNGCQYVAIPEISLELDNNLTLTLPAEDYVSEFGSQDSLISKPSCEPRLGHHHDDDLLGEDVFIIGESTLRRYYTVFDVDALKIGFSLASSSRAAKVGAVSPALLDKTEDRQGEGKKENNGNSAPVIFLVQVTVKKSKVLY
jgi:hypothetical protein